jgi:hypothetical protein
MKANGEVEVMKNMTVIEVMTGTKGMKSDVSNERRVSVQGRRASMRLLCRYL